MSETSNVAEMTYLGVTVYSPSRVFVIAVMDDLAEENQDHSLVLRWASGAWSQTPAVDAVIGSCVVSEPGPTLVNVCTNGQVKLLLSSGTSREVIDSSENGPSDLIPLRAARTIGGQVFAGGMARRMYQRLGRDNWRPIDEGVFVQRGARTQSSGFLCLDGGNSREIFAAGYKGEIWYFDGDKWTAQGSPTNVALNAMRRTEDGLIYIAGMGGTLLRGRVGAWQVIQQTATTDDFWGAAVFQGIPYFSTRKAIYRLVNDELEKVDLRSLGAISVGHLDCDTEVMWSVGYKDLASTRDGRIWVTVDGPR